MPILAWLKALPAAFQSFYAFVKLLQSAYETYKRVRREEWFQKLLQAQQRLNAAKDSNELKYAARDIALLLGSL